MNTSNTKTKLTLSIDKNVLEEARKASDKKHVTISAAVENFLRFYANPAVYCLKCGEKFESDQAQLCPKCGWMICPKCNACRCSLNEETGIAVFHMRKVYEDLLVGRVKK